MHRIFNALHYLGTVNSKASIHIRLWTTYRNRGIPPESAYIVYIYIPCNNDLYECTECLPFFPAIRMMARNDNNKKSLAAHGVIPLLVKLAEGKDVKEKRGIYTVHCS